MLMGCMIMGLRQKKSTHTHILIMNTVQQAPHPGGPSSRCPAWKMPTHFCSWLLSNRTYSNAAPGCLMLLVKRRALDWISLLRYTPPENTHTSSASLESNSSHTQLFFYIHFGHFWIFFYFFLFVRTYPSARKYVNHITNRLLFCKQQICLRDKGRTDSCTGGILEDAIVAGNSPPWAFLLVASLHLRLTLAVVTLIQLHHFRAPWGVRQAEVPGLGEKW